MTMFQFGTSRFLQAHVDLFASEARDAGQNVPPITIIQTTQDPERARRVAAFGRAEGFPVILRGLGRQGAPVDRTVQVRSVTRGLAAATQWDKICDLFAQSATHVISNTGDEGYRIPDTDRGTHILDGGRPDSFPAMLLALLHHRWRLNATPVTILPCELVRRNGAVLRGIVGDLALAAQADPRFIDWLETQCLWVNTLVDRIVSEPIEPVGAVAEPYALWAVEQQPGLTMPFHHPDIILTDDLEPYERLKLHILNLGHSWLAQRWIDQGQPQDQTVRAMMNDPDTLAALTALYAQEVVPGFATHGLAAQAEAYVGTTLARFANPWLDHRLADIASGHAAKLDKRVAGFIAWVMDRQNAPVLSQLHHLMEKVTEAPIL